MQVVRRDAARVKTILNQKAAAAATTRRRRPDMPKRILQGTVTSDKNDQTITVLVERRFTHPVLKKTVRKSKKYRAHDAQNQFKVGDSVRIVECAPISKTKRWRCWRRKPPRRDLAPQLVETAGQVPAGRE